MEDNYFLIIVGLIPVKLDSEKLGKILNYIISNYNLLALQLFDNQSIWGYRHLYSTIWHTLNAKKKNKMITNSLSMELLLYAAAQRQIIKAISLLGIKKDTKEVVGILIGNDESQLINANEKLIEVLQITPSNQILTDFQSKSSIFQDLLVKEGFFAKKLDNLEIEKAILQRIALFAIDV